MREARRRADSSPRARRRARSRCRARAARGGAVAAVGADDDARARSRRRRRVSAFARTSATLTPSRTSAPASAALLHEEVVEPRALRHVARAARVRGARTRGRSARRHSSRSTTSSTTGSIENGSSRAARPVTPPPHGLSRGKIALSTSSTRAPARASRWAAIEPGRPGADDRDVERAHGAKATIPAPGGVPERPKGTGCKPVGSAYGGSNPPAPHRTGCGLRRLARPWGREDSNLRRLSRRVYSPFPLAARAHPRERADCSFGPVSAFDVAIVGAGPAGLGRRVPARRARARACCSSTRRSSRATSRAAAASPGARRACCRSRSSPSSRTSSTGSSAGSRYGAARSSARARAPLAYMTQRRRLDHFLVEQGRRGRRRRARRREGRRRSSERLTVDGDEVAARIVIGADGCNGSAREAARPRAARSCTASRSRRTIRTRRASRTRWRSSIAAVRGGYGWVFPKGDHVNVGVGGDESEGPKLRAHLRRCCEAHGIDPDAAHETRAATACRCAGRARRSRAARAAVIGDAAGLVDPFSGDGMYEAFLSAQLVTDAALDVLAGQRRRPRALRRRGRAADHAADARRLGRQGRVRPLPAHDVRDRAAPGHVPGRREAAPGRARPSRRGPGPRKGRDPPDRRRREARGRFA